MRSRSGCASAFKSVTRLSKEARDRLSHGLRRLLGHVVPGLDPHARKRPGHPVAPDRQRIAVEVLEVVPRRPADQRRAYDAAAGGEVGLLVRAIDLDPRAVIADHRRHDLRLGHGAAPVVVVLGPHRGRVDAIPRERVAVDDRLGRLLALGEEEPVPPFTGEAGVAASEVLGDRQPVEHDEPGGVARQRHAEGHERAPVVPDDRVVVVHEGVELGRHRALAHVGVALARLSVAGQVGADDREPALGEQRSDTPPRRVGARVPVQEHDRWSGAPAAHPQRRRSHVHMPQREAIHSCELPKVSTQHVSAEQPRAHVRTTDKGANRMIRFNARALATAGLAAAMLASSAAAAAAADGPADEKAPLDAVVSAYQRAYPRISLEMAQRGAEQQDARKALYEQLIGKDGASFGGAWYDAPAGILHIATTDPALARSAQEMGKAQGLAVTPLLVKRSFDELTRLAASVRDSELGKVAQGNIGVDPESNQVIVAVPASQLDAMARQAPDGVKLVAAPGVKTEEDAGCTSRFACDWTIRGGAGIWRGSAGNNVCSVGFTARNSSNTRFTYTAGHCSNGNGVIWGTGGQTIGPMSSSLNASFLDASVIQVTNGWFTGDRGGELYRETSPGRSAAVNGVAPTLSFIWTGDVTCLSANFTQANGPNFCGVIGSVMDWSVRGMTRVDGLDACPGDSGGGWYWLTSSGRRIASGIHRRSDNGCHGSSGGFPPWFTALPLVKTFLTPSLNVEVRP